MKSCDVLSADTQQLFNTSATFAEDPPLSCPVTGARPTPPLPRCSPGQAHARVLQRGGGVEVLSGGRQHQLYAFVVGHFQGVAFTPEGQADGDVLAELEMQTERFNHRATPARVCVVFFAPKSARKDFCCTLEQCMSWPARRMLSTRLEHSRESTKTWGGWGSQFQSRKQLRALAQRHALVPGDRSPPAGRCTRSAACPAGPAATPSTPSR